MGNRRVFRQHWLVKLTLPGLPWFSFIALISVAVLYLLRYSHHALWLLVIVVFPFLKLFRLYLKWLGYSISTDAGSDVLVERSGLFTVSERRIPLTQFATVSYHRSWWASLLCIDVADVTVGAIGGPYVLTAMGGFSDLWEVIQSRGQIVPPKQPSVVAVLPPLLWRSTLALLRLIFTGLFTLGSSLTSPRRRDRRRAASWVRFAFDTDAPPTLSKAGAEQAGSAFSRPGVPDGGYSYGGVSFSPLNLSYAGFCAFCHQFIFMDKNWTRWHYRARDASRRYYPGGILDQVAHFYLYKLREVCILIPGPNGCSGERLSCRIKSVEDIQRLILDSSEPLDDAAWLR